jgi:hypothetical protein
MANIIYTNFITQMGKNNIDWETANIYCMLERSTSTYTPNRDHDSLVDLDTDGFVEISVASYERQLITGAVVANDDANDRAEFDFNNISFGNLEPGQTVNALIFYVEGGLTGTDTTGDLLICYIDTDANTILPAPLGGGSFDITVNAEGFIWGYQV